MATLDPSQLTITKTETPGQLPPSSSLVFGQTFTDHMLQVKWTAARGWEAPVIKPYGDLAISPAASVLHYATTLFEGMKAYKDRNGVARLFRPSMNAARMIRSAQRLAFPTFEPEALIELIKQLVKLDEHFIPSDPGCSLYIRPTMIGTRGSLGVTASTEVLLYVIMSPCGRYYPTGAKPVSLLASSHDVRAWPGGTGQFKLGLNYSGGILPQANAALKGYQQMLWLVPQASGRQLLLEVGVMNLFVAIRSSDDTVELLTPSLESGMILPGVTRDSVLALARAHADPANPIRIQGLPDKLVVTERDIYMDKIVDAAFAGTLLEIWGTGTAAVISSVERIGHEEHGDIKVPVNAATGMGDMAAAMLREIEGRQLGEIESDWSVVVA